MQSVSEIVSTTRSQDKTIRSERASILKDLFSLYSCPSDRMHRKRENWKRYCEWCRSQKVPDSKMNRQIFRRSWRFVKEMNVKAFCIKLAPLKEPDLYYMLSVARDRSNRGEPVGAWIFSSIKTNYGTRPLEAKRPE